MEDHREVVGEVEMADEKSYHSEQVAESLEPVAGVTNLRWTEELWLPIPVLGELFLALYRPVLTRLMRRSLENLRRGLLRKG